MFASRCSAARALRLVVDGRVQRVAVEREADRHEVRRPVGAHRREPHDARRREQLRGGRAFQFRHGTPLSSMDDDRPQGARHAEVRHEPDRPARTPDPELHLPRRRRRRPLRSHRARSRRRPRRRASTRCGSWITSTRSAMIGPPENAMFEAYTLLGAHRRPHLEGAARHDGHGRDVPQPRAARQDRHVARRDLVGSRDPRHRLGLERAGARAATGSTSTPRASASSA